MTRLLLRIFELFKACWSRYGLPTGDGSGYQNELVSTYMFRTRVFFKEKRLSQCDQCILFFIQFHSQQNSLFTTELCKSEKHSGAAYGELFNNFYSRSVSLVINASLLLVLKHVFQEIVKYTSTGKIQFSVSMRGNHFASSLVMQSRSGTLCLSQMIQPGYFYGQSEWVSSWNERMNEWNFLYCYYNN